MGINFNGTNQRVTTGPISATNNQGALSTSYWFKADTFAVATNVLWQYSIGTNAGLKRFAAELIGATATTAHLRINARSLDADPVHLFSQNGNPITPGSWIHMAVCVSFTPLVGGLCQIYLNGLLDSQGAFGGTFGSATTDTTDSEAFGMGADSSGGGAGFVACTLADFRLYQKLLSPAEVETIYNSEGHDGDWDTLANRWQMIGPEAGVVTAVPNLGSNNIQGVPSNSPIYQSDVLSLQRWMNKAAQLITDPGLG
jgi:hypothetical protein